MSQSQIDLGIESLLEQIEDTVSELNEEGAGAFKQGDYNRARSFLRDAERVSDFRYKVKSLQKEWGDLFYRPRNLPQAEKNEKTLPQKQFKGIRTTEEAFRKPVLESIVELKGSAPWEKILQRVEIRMKKFLNQYDLEEISSSAKTIRWHNTVRWCLNTMVIEGLIKNDSSENLWVILEKGHTAFRAMMKPEAATRENPEKENSNHSPKDAVEQEGTVKRFA